MTLFPTHTKVAAGITARSLSRNLQLTRSSMQGLSLIELLIATTIGIFMLTGIISLVVTVSQNRVELDKTSEQVENGRYAIQLLGDDLHNAGFYGAPSPVVKPGTQVYTVATNPDPCADAATVMSQQFGYIGSQVAVPVPVYGYASASNLNVTPATCAVSNLLAGSEALVVRRVGVPAEDVTSTWVPTRSTVYVQVSAKGSGQAIKTGATKGFFDTTPPLLLDKDGATAKVWPYSVRTYFLSSCDDCAANDGIPTLKVKEMTSTGLVERPLVEGIEDIHFEYGIDLVGSDGTSSTKDGSPDCYVVDPGVATAAISGCAVGTWTQAAPNNWINVTSVRIHLLARSIETSPSGTDSTRTYDLGRASRSGPFSDKYKRQVYTVVVALNNVSGARQ